MLDLPPLFADLHPSKDQHRIWEPTRLSFISWIIGTVKNFPSRNYLLLSQCKLIIAIIILIWDNFSKYTLSIKLGWSNMRNEIKLIKTSVTDCVFSITNNILRWNCNWWQVGVKYYYWTLKLFFVTRFVFQIYNLQLFLYHLPSSFKMLLKISPESQLSQLTFLYLWSNCKLQLFFHKFLTHGRNYFLMI